MSTVGDKSNFSLQWTNIASSSVFGHTFSPKFQTQRRVSESTFGFRLPEQANVSEFSISPIDDYRLAIPSVTIELIINSITLVVETFVGSHEERVYDLSVYLPQPKGSLVFIKIPVTGGTGANNYSCTLWGQYIRD